MEKYDLIIIGAGPAGMSAGIYAGRYKLKTLILSKDLGGTASTAHKICNFPSYNNINGFELMQKFAKHVKELEVPIIHEEVVKINKKNEKEKGGEGKQGFVVKTLKNEYFCKKIIFAGGTHRKKLGVKGEEDFIGKGVSYCATCDAGFFKDKIVSVVGGSDAALTAGLLLSEFASKVYIIYRKNKFFRAEPSWVELVEKEKKIEVLFNEEVGEIIGKGKVESVDLKSGKKLDVDGVFIEIGSVPEVNAISHLKIKQTDKGYVVVDKNQMTSVKGIYAVGDVTDNRLKQIVTASAEGAIAAYCAYKKVKRER